MDDREFLKNDKSVFLKNDKSVECIVYLNNMRVILLLFGFDER